MLAVHFQSPSHGFAMPAPFCKGAFKFLHLKEIYLAGFGHVAQCAQGLELLKVGLGELGAGGGQLLHGDEGGAGLLAAGQVQRGGFAKAGDGHKGRAQLLVLGDDKLGGV